MTMTRKNKKKKAKVAPRYYGPDESLAAVRCYLAPDCASTGCQSELSIYFLGARMMRKFKTGALMDWVGRFFPTTRIRYTYRKFDFFLGSIYFLILKIFASTHR